MATAILTQERLKELLNYNPETGIFTRLVRTAQRHKVGDRADFLINSGNAKGYSRVSVGYERYLSHRLAWFYVYGEFPKYQIDHINGNTNDNRICNLRDVVSSINAENKHKASKSSKSGYLGVFWHEQSKKWRARLQVNKKGVHIGLYDTPQLAHEAYLKVKRKLHEGCTI